MYCLSIISNFEASQGGDTHRSLFSSVQDIDEIVNALLSLGHVSDKQCSLWSKDLMIVLRRSLVL